MHLSLLLFHLGNLQSSIIVCTGLLSHHKRRMGYGYLHDPPMIFSLRWFPPIHRSWLGIKYQAIVLFSILHLMLMSDDDAEGGGCHCRCMVICQARFDTLFLLSHLDICTYPRHWGTFFSLSLESLIAYTYSVLCTCSRTTIWSGGMDGGDYLICIISKRMIQKSALCGPIIMPK